MDKHFIKTRLLYIPFFVIFLVGLIVGSFSDLSISKSIADTNNLFGKIVATFGMLPINLIAGLCAGGLFALAFYEYKKRNMQVISIVLGVIVVGAVTYLIGHEMNDSLKMAYIAYPLSFIFTLLAAVWGFLLVKENKHTSNLFGMIIVAGLAIAIVLIAVNYGIKLFMPRCRPRFVLGVTGGDESYFTNWYQPYNVTQTLKDTFGKDEFKSFPSGHTTSATVAIFALPLLSCFNSKFKKHEWWLILVGGVWALLVAFGRVLYGAHYLSDVSFAGLLTIIVVFVADLLIHKYFDKKNGMGLKE